MIYNQYPYSIYNPTNVNLDYLQQGNGGHF